MSDENDEFDWGRLGEAWWIENAKSAGATQQQTKFACAKHCGCSNTAAARAAAYGGDEATIRQQGYRAFRTTAVQNLLALAASEDKGGTDGTVDSAEARRILSRLARGSDPSVRIRAVEALTKLDERAAQAEHDLDGDGFGEWRTVRSFLQTPNGGPAILHLWLGTGASVSGIPLLHDVHNAVMRDDPGLWARARERQSPMMRGVLEEHLADPTWQAEARAQIWREVGIDINKTPDPTLTPLFAA